MKSYAEKDIVLARLAGEHVHKWEKNRGTLLILEHWRCADKECDHWIESSEKPPAATPRAHSIGAMIDFIHSLAGSYELETITKGCVEATVYFEKTLTKGNKVLWYKEYDGPSKVEVDCHALYEAIKAAMEKKDA